MVKWIAIGLLVLISVASVGGNYNRNRYGNIETVTGDNGYYGTGISSGSVYTYTDSNGYTITGTRTGSLTTYTDSYGNTVSDWSN